MAFGGISTYGFSLHMIAQNSNLQQQMVSLQQQIATGVKSQDLKGYGVDSLRLQNARIDIKSIDSYIYNIQTATTRIKQMTLNVQEAEKQTERILAALTILPVEGDIDLSNIKALADKARIVLESLMNDKNGDDYLFAGSDTKNKPLDNANNLPIMTQSQVNDFLDGTNPVDQFLTNINSYTDSQVGYSLGVQSSTTISVRADDHFEVDYTVKANDTGFKDILVHLTVLSQITVPDPSVDVASRDDFFKALGTIQSRLQAGVNNLRHAEVKLASAEASIGHKLENHTEDKGFLASTIEDIQHINPTEAIIKFQSLQTQLEAAFRATSIISGLSLARML